MASSANADTEPWPAGTVTVKVKFKNLEVVLHYSIYLVQCTSTTGSKTTAEHDVTTTVLDSCYSVLRFESFTFTYPNMPLVVVIKYLNLCFI